MAKPIVVLIHGMGNHTAPRPTSNERGSFGNQCIDTLNTAFQMYPSLQASRIEDSVSFVEIHYNHLFERFRKEMAEKGQRFEDLLKGAGTKVQLGNVPDLVQAVIGFEASLDSNDIFFTHWLDVILYKLYFGEFVRVHVAKKLGEIMTRNNPSNIHILAHSLGTAVIHDTLEKIYSNDYADDDEVADLSTGTHKLGSLWQIANVSRLANSVLKIADPYRSIVKPGKDGVTSTMMNIHHKLDPFTLLKKYTRHNNGKWIPNNIFQSSYRDIETTDITQLNTHSITQYLHDPGVHLHLFNRLDIPIPSKKQRNAAAHAYGNLVLNKAQAKLESKLENVVKGNTSTLKDFYVAAKQLADVIKSEAA